MHDYQRTRRERESLLRELCQLGFSVLEIAKATGWSQAVVTSDVQRLGGMGAFPDRSRKEKAVFAATLRRYAELAFGGHRDDDRIWGVLGGHRHIQTLRAFIEGAAVHQLSLESIGIKLPDGYRELLAAIFRESEFFSRLPESGKEVSLGGKCFADLLQEVHEGRIPESAAQAQWRLVELLNERFGVGNIIALSEPAGLIERIEQALRSLSQREEMAVRMHFGIGYEPMTLDQIGAQEVFKVSRERVRQIEMRALAKLRHPSRANSIRACFTRLCGLAANCEALGRECEGLRAEVAALHQHIREARIAEPPCRTNPPILDMRVTDLELTMRAANCLAKARIRYVGELVQKTEEELLRINWFGRKSLKEIKDELARLEPPLTLDMKLEGWKPPAGDA